MPKSELEMQVEYLKENGYRTPDWLYCLAVGVVLRASDFSSYSAIDTLMSSEDNRPIVDLLSKRTVSRKGDLTVLYRGPVSRVRYQVLQGRRQIATLSDQYAVTVVTNNFEGSRARGKKYSGWWATFD